MEWKSLNCKRCNKEVIKIREGTRSDIVQKELMCYECRVLIW